MTDLNEVVLIGRLTRDPELRSTPQGSAVCSFSIATNRKFRKKDGSDGEDSCFVDIETWGRQAENCSQYLTKGSEVFVNGSLRLSRWEGKDGQKHSKLRVTARRVQFLRTSRNGDGGGNGRGNGRAGGHAVAAEAEAEEREEDSTA